MTHTSINGIDAGPRTLAFMPKDQQADLDPYMAQVVGYRKSGLSLNHIIGCPLDCAYCVRHFWGNFDVKTPQLLMPTHQAVELLVNHKGFRQHTTPLQIFNKATDPFLPGVKPHLFEALTDLDNRGLTNLVLIITRFRVTPADMARLEALRNLRVTLLFTYSGITDSRIEPIAKTDMTVTSLRTAASTENRRTKVILYWRPIVPGWNDAPETMAHVLDVGRDADAIVFTGYYHKPENAEYLHQLGVPLPYDINDTARRKALPAELDAQIIAAWRATGARAALFRKTSCGVSFVHAAPDYNGHWGVNEVCDICPATQRTLCQQAHRPPTDTELQTLFDQLGYSSPTMLDGGHLWTTGLSEQQRYLIQHQTGFQIWDLDLPHFAHQHGRSTVGHDPSQAEQQHLEQVRVAFGHQARFDDE